MQKYQSKDTSIVPFIFYVTCFLIVYGSTYPFEFSSTVSSELLQGFFQSWHEHSGWGDILGNIALFFPFGYLGYLYFGGGRSLFQALLRLCVICFALAMGCQVVQLYIPARSPSLFDLYGNGLGFLIGFAAAFITGGHQLIRLRERGLFESVALVLVGLWVSVRLLPFVPTIDWQSYKDAVKPLLLTPKFSWSEFLLTSVCWVAVAWMGKNILGDRWRTGYFPISIALILGLEIVVVNNTLSLSDVCAGIVAVLIWLGVSRKSQTPCPQLAWLLLAGYAIDAWLPFVMAYSPSTFHWLPFTGFLEGSMLINASALSEKLFVFGAIFWLLNQTRSLSFIKIALVTLIILMTEIAQLWNLGRTSELTDPLLVLLIGYLTLRLRGSQGAPEVPCAVGVAMSMSSMISPQMELESGERTGSVSAHDEIDCPPPMQVQDAAVEAGVQILRESGVVVSPPGSEPSLRPELPVGSVANSCGGDSTLVVGHRKSVLWGAGGACLVIMLAAFVVLRLPGVPYNIRELFLFGGNGVDLFFFSMALLSFGWTSAWVGCRIANSSRPVVVAPLAALAASIVIYVLFTFSVTRESIMDVSGSSVVVHRVGSRGVLGQPGIDFVAMVGVDNLRGLTDIFEPVIRFGALIGPVIIFLGVMLAAQFRLARVSARPFSTRASVLSGRLFIYLLLMLPWLYFCKVIAFDWSSTDNLNELIAPDGYFGWGGGGYLYALIALVTTCAGLLAWSRQCDKSYMLKMLFFIVLSLPLAWWLLNGGLSANVNKYGLEFSGVDFLLGPDRRHQLAEIELFWRWSFVYFSMVGGLAFGAALYLSWIRDGTGSPGAVAPIEKHKKGGIVRKGVKGELEVYFHQHQVDFLGNVAVQLNGTLSSTAGAIIDCLDQEMSRSSSVKSYVYTQMRTESTLVSIDSAMVPHCIDLPEELMAFVSDLQEREGISASRAVRKLVDFFMLMSKEAIDINS